MPATWRVRKTFFEEEKASAALLFRFQVLKTEFWESKEKQRKAKKEQRKQRKAKKNKEKQRKTKKGKEKQRKTKKSKERK